MVRGKPAGVRTAPRQQKGKGAPGRPSLFSDDLGEEICTRLMNAESMRSICKLDHMPDRATVLRWMGANPEFAAKCARARSEQADFIHDDMADIEDKVETGRLAPDVARVILSSKQWRAAKLAPKKYGDKIVAEHTGKDGGPIQVDLSGLSDAQLEALEPVLVQMAAKADAQGPAR